MLASHGIEALIGSSQLVLIFSVRAVGELKGDVTGALSEPPGMWRWRGILGEEDEDEPDERFLIHGMRELASGFVMGIGGLWERAGLGKEDEVGLGLYDAHGLGWYDEQGLADADPPTMSMRSTGLHPCM